MESTVQRPSKRTFFVQAGPDAKPISKLDQQLFSLSPPTSPDKLPVVPLRSISGNSLPDSSSGQNRVKANEEAGGVCSEDSALSLDFGAPVSLGEESNHIFEVQWLLTPFFQEGTGNENVSLPEVSQPMVENGVRRNNGPSKPAQESLVVSEISRPGEGDRGNSSPSQCKVLSDEYT